MVIKFKMGKGPEYNVTNFDVGVGTTGGGQLANCAPDEIRVNLEIAPQAAPAKDLFDFASQQHSKAASDGSGTITVFKGRDGVSEGESLQTIEFSNAWLSDLDSSISIHDDKFNVSFTIVAATVKVSDVEFEHAGRGEMFQ